MLQTPMPTKRVCGTDSWVHRSRWLQWGKGVWHRFLGAKRDVQCHAPVVSNNKEQLLLLFINVCMIYCVRNLPEGGD
jgi:hypothetical protein